MPASCNVQWKLWSSEEFGSGPPNDSAPCICAVGNSGFAVWAKKLAGNWAYSASKRSIMHTHSRSLGAVVTSCYIPRRLHLPAAFNSGPSSHSTPCISALVWQALLFGAKNLAIHCAYLASKAYKECAQLLPKVSGNLIWYLIDAFTFVKKYY